VTDAGPPAPFFEAKGGSAASRRLLLISALFPPAPDVGALRWQKMARHVAERGWELDVLMQHPDDLASPDWSRLSDLPPGTRLFGLRPPSVPLVEAVETVWRWLRALEARVSPGRRDAVGGDARRTRPSRPESIPRREIGWSLGELRGYVRAFNAWSLYAELDRWARQASAVARRIADRGAHDAVVSSGPPHAAHEAARRVSLRTGLPFVMDMRDVWGLAQRCSESIASPLLLHLAHRYERRAVAQASLVVANTEAARTAMVRVHPEAARRIVTVMNGFDEEPLPPARPEGRFVIAYAGSIYLDRDPGCLFRAARMVIDELALSPSELAVRFIGVSDFGAPLTEMAAAAGIADFFEFGGTCPRAQALEFLAQASMLVILPQDTDMAVPAKLFEYVRFDAWLLAVADRGSAIETVLRGTAADVVSSADVAAIAAVLRRRYEEHVAGVRPRAIAEPRLSRRHQAALLLDAFERHVVSTRRDGVGARGMPDDGGRAPRHAGRSDGLASPFPRSS
jgi:glycosyltransferase involved in cell wall biosynthesis